MQIFYVNYYKKLGKKIEKYSFMITYVIQINIYKNIYKVYNRGCNIVIRYLNNRVILDSVILDNMIVIL